MTQTEFQERAEILRRDRRSRIYNAMVDLVRESIGNEPLNGALVSVSAVVSKAGIQIDAVVKISEFIAD